MGKPGGRVLLLLSCFNRENNRGAVLSSMLVLLGLTLVGWLVQ
jgi:hypothetical protein